MQARHFWVKGFSIKLLLSIEILLVGHLIEYVVIIKRPSIKVACFDSRLEALTGFILSSQSFSFFACYSCFLSQQTPKLGLNNYCCDAHLFGVLSMSRATAWLSSLRFSSDYYFYKTTSCSCVIMLLQGII